MLVRTTRDGVCVTNSADVDCTSGIERFVYAGDNVLWEMRGPGSASSTTAELDQAIGTGQEYGAIGYTHAGGVDRPLAAYKLGVNAAVIAPHTNWRGQFSGGMYLQGSQSTAPVSWPGYSTTAWYQGKPPQEQNRVYMGTVLEGQRDASGQMYMRNRMYDPATGQFTQTDPIGIAGGLNTYGFAAGDPVSYDDPYGLCPPISSCLAGNGPKTAVTVADLRKGDRRHIRWPIDVVITPTENTTVRSGFNAQGQLIVFMQGGAKFQTDYLPDEAGRIPINFAAANIDTGSFDVWGTIGLNFVTVSVQGNFRDGSYQGKFCVMWVKCIHESQAPSKRSNNRQGDSEPQKSDAREEQQTGR